MTFRNSMCISCTERVESAEDCEHNCYLHKAWVLIMTLASSHEYMTL